MSVCVGIDVHRKRSQVAGRSTEDGTPPAAARSALTCGRLDWCW